jgi:hypothetical protein
MVLAPCMHVHARHGCPRSHARIHSGHRPAERPVRRKDHSTNALQRKWILAATAILQACWLRERSWHECGPAVLAWRFARAHSRGRRGMEDRAGVSYASAALTRAAVNGALRSRRPVSANTAFETAGTTPGMPSSPTGSGVSPERITSTLICGVSESRRIS